MHESCLLYLCMSPVSYRFLFECWCWLYFPPSNQFVKLANCLIVVRVYSMCFFHEINRLKLFLSWRLRRSPPPNILLHHCLILPFTPPPPDTKPFRPGSASPSPPPPRISSSSSPTPLPPLCLLLTVLQLSLETNNIQEQVHWAIYIRDMNHVSETWLMYKRHDSCMNDTETHIFRNKSTEPKKS